MEQGCEVVSGALLVLGKDRQDCLEVALGYVSAFIYVGGGTGQKQHSAK